MDRDLNVEAVELVLRRRRPALTRKVRILLYLIESTPSGYHHFANDRDRRIGGWFALFVAGVRTIARTIQGQMILRRHADLMSA
jgi:hypothetical protein